LTDGLLTIGEVAGRVGKDPKTVWRWVRFGIKSRGTVVRLMAIKIGREWMVNPADLAGFLRRLTDASVLAAP
jgi:hypothetical protein